MFSLIPSEANDPQGLMRREEPTNQTNKQTNKLFVCGYEFDEFVFFFINYKLMLILCMVRSKAEDSQSPIPCNVYRILFNMTNIYSSKVSKIGI